MQMTDFANADTWQKAQGSVLGSMLIDDRCSALVFRLVTEQDFIGPFLTLFRGMKKMFLSGMTIDPVAVLDQVGNQYRTFIVDLMEITPTAANVEIYAEICRKQSRIYRLRELGAQMQETEDLDAMNKLVESASAVVADKPGVRIVTMADAMKSFMDRHSGPEPDYLNWPIDMLDKHIYAEPGDFIVIGAEPSVGKTAWALQCAWHFAEKYKVGFFSLETKDQKLFDRKMADVMDIDMGRMKRNRLQHDDWDRICSRTPIVLERNLELVNASGWTAADIRAVTIMRGYEVIFVDYLQLVQGQGRDRPAVVAGVSMGLHTLAQSLSTTVIALSQLTVDDDKKGAPTIESLRESRQIGQDADVVMMLYLEDRKNRDGPRFLSIQKNKEGKPGSVLLHFDGAHQVFSQKPREEVKQTKKQMEQAPVPGQMNLLPPDTPVPF